MIVIMIVIILRGWEGRGVHGGWVALWPIGMLVDIGWDLAERLDSERLRFFFDRQTDICNCRVAFATFILAFIWYSGTSYYIIFVSQKHLWWFWKFGILGSTKIRFLSICHAWVRIRTLNVSHLEIFHFCNSYLLPLFLKLLRTLKTSTV